MSIVQEIISTGGTVSVQDVKEYTGQHLTPQEFHECLLQHQPGGGDSSSINKKNIVLIDVRNTFEHAIGHFVLPADETPAVNPETVTFSSFDATFCATHAEKLKDCKVLMYCTVRGAGGCITFLRVHLLSELLIHILVACYFFCIRVAFAAKKHPAC